ncbi:MAG: hypothetical protein OSB23_10730 [Porticoccaceae bacterium]|nr:hypothetical protein [Porticoccaceae bacterium]
MLDRYKNLGLLPAKRRRITAGLAQYSQINTAPTYIISRDGTFYRLERSGWSKSVQCDYLV